MKRVLLLNPPGNKLYLRDMYCSSVSKARYYWPPIDLLVLSGILSQHYEVNILDAIIEKTRVKECREKIEKGNYKAVIFLTGTASWKQDFDFLATLKNAKSKPLLIGNGDILLYEPKAFLERYPFLDAILLDYTSHQILSYLKNDYQGITSMAFRADGETHIRKAPITPGEFSYPVPGHEKFPLRKYLLALGKRFPFTVVQTSFGCPFRCSFCIASTLGFKYRPVENVMEELRHIHSLGIKEVFFTDFTFEARRKNSLELCRQLVKEGLRLSWVCSSRASTLDRELLTWMKLAGCHTILLGVESGAEDILREYSKGTTKADMRKAFSLCRELGIRTLGHFIIGLPGETELTVSKTIDFARELACDFASFNLAVPSLGTPLREMALRNGWLKEKNLEFDSSESYPVMETPQFSKQQAWTYRNKAIRKFYFRPSYLWRRATASHSLYEWKILILNGLSILIKLSRKG